VRQHAPVSRLGLFAAPGTGEVIAGWGRHRALTALLFPDKFRVKTPLIGALALACPAELRVHHLSQARSGAS
jgi:hypothetical protein